MPPTDLLVIGSGIAGLTAALHAARSVDVLLVTKTALVEGSTRYAQGGIAGAIDPSDTPAEHAQDTLSAGAGLCDAEAVRVLCEEGPAAIADLIDRGVVFDRAHDLDPAGELDPDPDPAGELDPYPDPESAAARSLYALGLEGAHSRPRILHAGGDATGRAIEDALAGAVRALTAVPSGSTARGSLTLREDTALVDLLLEGGRVSGAELLAADGTRLAVRARATLLATGGAGQLFSHTTNPAVSTGDGIAAAWRAGAAVEDLEFYQFHPTALAAPGSFLISEAVRGEGAVLRDEHGRRFLPAIDPRVELAPRDVVARAIAQVMAAQDGRPVVLDATGIGAQRLRERFPTIDAAVRGAGFDWGREPVPVTPAAHYWMGGIRTDLDGRTTLPGLLAAGECARTGVHGANRLASNSLLEGAVFGARAACAALRDASSGAVCAASPHTALPAHHAPVDAATSAGSDRSPAPAGSAPSPAPAGAGPSPALAGPDLSPVPTGSGPSPALAGPDLSPVPTGSGPSPALAGPDLSPAPAGPRAATPHPMRAASGPGRSERWTRADLQELLWSHAGLLRTGEQLDAAAAQLSSWQDQDPDSCTTVAELEDRNLLHLARLLIGHALARPGSVGAHHRLDDPRPLAAQGPVDTQGPADARGRTDAHELVDARTPAPSTDSEPAQEALAC
ncbi:FAD-binding protein [Brachybacterium sp. 107]|uniref:FAD-binding protein n=1 Tax=Brachybacterium sp. 107 TaxID=3457736 RepID=UPI0040349611